ncbi:MAG: arylsulfatase [Cyclobacteriaceae bacterium]|nr:arylsulfatase [Cyclobacteriaceae bacterium]
MRHLSFIIITLTAAIALPGCKSNPPTEKKNNKPNIIFILADDLGYSEVGVYGQDKIETPNIDQLAATGMRFTNFYSGAPVCAPARSVLLTGLHSGHTPIRGNHEWGERGDVWDFAKAVTDPNLEGQYPLPDSTITLAKVLQNSGYATGMVGKWGLGGPLSNSIPNTMGFDFFYGYNCQRQAHTYFPQHLWKNREKVLLNNKLVVPNTKLEKNSDPLDTASYADYHLTDYAPRLMHEEALQFIADNKANPFFLYYASPIPHAPLQAPRKWVDYYREKFGDETPYLGDRSYFPNRYPHATYAAMVSYLDEQVGELVQKLKTLGLYENTLIIFTSDNGPTFNGGSDSPYFNSAKPFKSERTWGKGYVKEGGIRVPMIASWPGIIDVKTESPLISSFYDMMPTLCEITGASVPPTDGLSMLPTMQGRPQDQVEHDYLYWEFPQYGGQQAVRMGDWKGIRSNIKNNKESMVFELYNLKTDITEENDVANEYPEIAAQIRQIFDKEHAPSDIPRFRMPQLGDPEE